MPFGSHSIYCQIFKLWQKQFGLFLQRMKPSPSDSYWMLVGTAQIRNAAAISGLRTHH